MDKSDGENGGSKALTRATLGRAQNKAHVEGAFGLFSQNIPRLRFEVSTTKELARAIVEIVARTFFGALNMRPRKAKKGQSRLEQHEHEQPTAEQLEHARRALEAILARREKARATRELGKTPPLEPISATHSSDSVS